VLREAWTQGVIDEHTLIWGQGLADWLPIKNVRTLVPQIRTVEGEPIEGAGQAL
jgi:GH35 family endo-1,4-beta-xylanase